MAAAAVTAVLVGAEAVPAVAMVTAAVAGTRVVACRAVANHVSHNIQEPSLPSEQRQ